MSSRTTTTLTLGFLAAFAFATSGCKLLKKDVPDAAPATEDTSTTAQAETPDAAAEEDAAAPAALASATATARALGIPPPQDPDTAAADITRTNFKAELDKIEKTIDSEK